LNQIRTRSGAASDAAGLQTDEQGSARNQLPIRFPDARQAVHFGVGMARLLVVAFANYAAIVHQDCPYSRVVFHPSVSQFGKVGATF
jgi:hypothetical protein